MWLDPSHKESRGNEQEDAYRQGNSEGQKFNRPVGRFAVLHQCEKTGGHAQHDQKQHDGDDGFDQSTTRGLCVEQQILPDSMDELP